MDAEREIFSRCPGVSCQPTISRFRFSMSLVHLFRLFFLLTLAIAPAQQKQYPKPTELPNPYRLVENWPSLPKNMNGGHWGEVIRVHVDAKGRIWVFHRCFNVVPA